MERDCRVRKDSRVPGRQSGDWYYQFLTWLCYELSRVTLSKTFTELSACAP